MKKKKKRLAAPFYLLFGILFVLGLGITLYPLLSNYYVERHQSAVYTEYRETLKETDDGRIKEALAAANAYNEELKKWRGSAGRVRRSPEPHRKQRYGICRDPQPFAKGRDPSWGQSENTGYQRRSFGRNVAARWAAKAAMPSLLPIAGCRGRKCFRILTGWWKGISFIWRC